MFSTKDRTPSIRNEFRECLRENKEFLPQYEIPFEDRYMLEAGYPGELLSPLRGGVHWGRDFQRLEVIRAKSDSFFPHAA